MEEYIEQIFSTPSWVDINGGTRAPWDFNNAPGVETGASVGNGGSEESMPSLGQATSAASTWRQPYIAGISPPLPLGALGQPKAESLSPQEGTSNGSHPMGKRSRDEEEDRCGPQENMFGTLMGQPQSARTGALQSMHQLQPMPGVSASTYGNHASLVQSQASGATIAAPARPRVRARRGQATDPHSIAERLRRERIAERMKALQDLVPSANKTDKASMLDEIIEYVRFLQLQVKVLSMSRLGGAGASMPCITEFFTEGYNNATMGASNGAQAPSQDGMATTEKHVAQLMEDNMGSAMQYLQSKGLCLMPVSLVATMPTRPPSAPAVQDISSSSPSNAVPPTTLLSPLHTNSDGAANDLSKGVRNPPTEHQARDCLTSPSTSAKSGGNNSKEEPVRRG